MKRKTFLALVLAITPGCTPPEAPVQAPEEEAPTASLPAIAPVAERRVVLLRMEKAKTDTDFRWSEEAAGLSTALLDAGLSDLPDVVVGVEGMQLSPGFSSWVGPERSTWRLSLRLSGGESPPGNPAAAEMDLLLTLCSDDGPCFDHRARSRVRDPSPAVAELLRAVAADMGVGLPPAAEDWALPVSADEYATLIAGRGAAVFYGLLPPSEDAAQDPVAKAVVIDPQIALSWWILGRRELGLGLASKARAAFTQAASLRSSSLLFAADEAAALGRLGHHDAALTAWGSLAERSPGDARFSLARAWSALDARRVDESAALLAALPADLARSSEAVALEVAIADARGGAVDELLARWQAADPGAQEPLRRRIALRVVDGRLEEALELSAELGRRGAEEEAARVRISLLIGLERWEEAALEAEALGDPSTAARIRARGGAPLDARDPRAMVLRGERALAAGDPALALMTADLVISEAPWLPEALALRARCLRALGQPTAEALLALRAADPRLVLPD